MHAAAAMFYTLRHVLGCGGCLAPGGLRDGCASSHETPVGRWALPLQRMRGKSNGKCSSEQHRSVSAILSGIFGALFSPADLHKEVPSGRGRGPTG